MRRTLRQSAGHGRFSAGKSPCERQPGRVPQEAPMLEQVTVPPLALDAYAPVAGDEAVEEIRSLAEDLRGARVLHVNATKFGGGVAEILPTLTALMRDVGLDAEWRII